jgi:hypothetical protein
MPHLHDMIGETITALIPVLDGKIMQQVILHGVEQGGIWVESQNLTNDFLSQVGASTAPKTMIIFFPYHQISYVFGSVDSSSEKSFGVEE